MTPQEIRGELAEALLDAPWDGSRNDKAAALLSTVQRLIADAEKRAAAAALRDAADGIGHWPGIGNLIRGQLRDRAAALDPAGAASGETT